MCCGAKLTVHAQRFPLRTFRLVLALLLRSFQFLDYHCLGAVPFVDLSTRTDLFARVWQQSVVLSGGWGGIGNGPIDRAILREDHERRSRLGAGGGAVAADGLFQAFGESARRIEHISL